MTWRTGLRDWGLPKSSKTAGLYKTQAGLDTGNDCGRYPVLAVGGNSRMTGAES